MSCWEDGSIVEESGTSLYEIFRFSFVEGIARIGVPLFFFISGFLFFYYDDFSKNVYLGKIKKRFKSLVVPYIFWNLVVVGFYFKFWTVSSNRLMNKHLTEYLKSNGND